MWRAFGKGKELAPSNLVQDVPQIYVILIAYSLVIFGVHVSNFLENIEDSLSRWIIILGPFKIKKMLISEYRMVKKKWTLNPISLDTFDSSVRS